MAPTRPKCSYNRRFSDEEKQSFGRWSFLAAGRRYFKGPAPCDNGSAAPQHRLCSRSTSAPTFDTTPEASLPPTPADSTDSQENGVNNFGYDLDKVSKLVRQMLPAA